MCHKEGRSAPTTVSRLVATGNKSVYTITQAVNMRVNSHSNKPLLTPSRGLTAWPWLFRMLGRAKALMKPSLWLGLARPIWAWLGLAHGLRPGHAHHYLEYYSCLLNSKRDFTFYSELLLSKKSCFTLLL